MADLELFSVHRELEEPLSGQHFGGSVEGKGLVGRIADRPVAFRVRDVLAGLKVDVPAEVDLYKRFELWLVPNRVSVIRERGLAEVVSVGLECEYAEVSGTLCVVELLPGPAFITHGALDGEFSCGGRLAASGSLTPHALGSAVTGSDAEEGDSAALERQGLTFSAKSRLGVTLSFQFSVATPYVHAVGIGSSRAQWRFDRHTEPLFGRDLTMWALIALPKEQRELRSRARMFATVRTAFFPTRIESDWQEVLCQLEA